MRRVTGCRRARARPAHRGCRPRGRLRRARRRERHHPADPNHHARRLARRHRALRDQLRVQWHRRGGRVDRPAPRGYRSRSSAAATGPCSDCGARSARRRSRPRPSRPPDERSTRPRCCNRRTVDALDITILRGGGDAVGKWAIDHGFLLTPDAPEVLDFYSERSQIFMAARFDAARAARLGQQSGDGTPIMLTIPIDAPWVPLRILALGLDADHRDRRRRVPAHRRATHRARRGPRGAGRRERTRRRPSCSTTSAPTSTWAGSPTRCGSRT